MWIFLWITLPQSHCLNLTLCETHLDDSLDSSPVRGYLPLFRKDSVTNIDGLAVYMKMGLSFAQDLFLQNSPDSYYVFDWFYFLQCLTSFSCIDHLVPLCAWFLMLFHPANVFVFWDFNVHHEDWLTFSGGINRPQGTLIIFLSQTTLLRWLTFLHEFFTVTLTDLFIWIYFFLQMVTFVLQWPPLHWEILINVFSQIPYSFLQTQKGYPFSKHKLLLLLSWLGWSSWWFGDVLWVDIFKTQSFCCWHWISWVGPGCNWCISLIVNIMSNLTHHHGFQLIVLLT